MHRSLFARFTLAALFAAPALLSCSSESIGPDPEGEEPPALVPTVYGVGNAYPQLGVTARAVGWDFDRERVRVVGLGSDPIAFADMLGDTIVYVTDEAPGTLRWPGSTGRDLELSDGESRRILWFHGAGAGLAWVHLGETLYRVDLATGASLDSLDLPPDPVIRTHGDHLVIASEGPAQTLTVHVVRDGDVERVDRFDVGMTCILPRDLLVQPAGQVNVLCTGTGNEFGSIDAVSLDDGRILGRVEHVQLGASFYARQRLMAGIASTGEIAVIARGQELLLYDPATFTFSRTVDPAVGPTSVRAMSVVYDTEADRLVVARHPEPLDLGGPFDFAVIDPASGSVERSFSSGVFLPLWTLAR